MNIVVDDHPHAELHVVDARTDEEDHHDSWEDVAEFCTDGCVILADQAQKNPHESNGKRHKGDRREMHRTSRGDPRFRRAEMSDLFGGGMKGLDVVRHEKSARARR